MRKPRTMTALLALSGCVHVACAHVAGEPGRKGKMAITTGQTNELQFEFSVPYRLKSGEDLEAQVTLTNLSTVPMRLNTITLQSGTLVLRFKKTDGTPVRTGPPPLPTRDDGNTGRIVLGSGQSAAFAYHGSDLFPGVDLENGDYLVRFVYRNGNNTYHDWTGAIETEWLSFELQR